MYICLLARNRGNEFTVVPRAVDSKEWKPYVEIISLNLRSFFFVPFGLSLPFVVFSFFLFLDRLFAHVSRHRDRGSLAVCERAST